MTSHTASWDIMLTGTWIPVRPSQDTSAPFLPENAVPPTSHCQRGLIETRCDQEVSIYGQAAHFSADVPLTLSG
jgi:hypothetical protein